MRKISALFLIAAAALAGCAQHSGTVCPGQTDPGRLTTRQLIAHGIGGIPERGSTARERVVWAVDHRRGWIERNYPDVVDVVAGPGWGVTYSNDQYGNTTYHHVKDYMVVTIVGTKAACPDPERGILFIIGRNERIPVRFEYQKN
jgi:hypothetical protein